MKGSSCSTKPSLAPDNSISHDKDGEKEKQSDWEKKECGNPDGCLKTDTEWQQKMQQSESFHPAEKYQEEGSNEDENEDEEDESIIEDEDLSYGSPAPGYKHRLHQAKPLTSSSPPPLRQTKTQVSIKPCISPPLPFVPLSSAPSRTSSKLSSPFEKIHQKVLVGKKKHSSARYDRQISHSSSSSSSSSPSSSPASSSSSSCSSTLPSPSSSSPEISRNCSSSPSSFPPLTNHPSLEVKKKKVDRVSSFQFGFVESNINNNNNDSRIPVRMEDPSFPMFWGAHGGEGGVAVRMEGPSPMFWGVRRGEGGSDTNLTENLSFSDTNNTTDPATDPDPDSMSYLGGAGGGGGPIGVRLEDPSYPIFGGVTATTPPTTAPPTTTNNSRIPVRSEDPSFPMIWGLGGGRLSGGELERRSRSPNLARGGGVVGLDLGDRASGGVTRDRRGVVSPNWREGEGGGKRVRRVGSRVSFLHQDFISGLKGKGGGVGGGIIGGGDRGQKDLQSLSFLLQQNSHALMHFFLSLFSSSLYPSLEKFASLLVNIHGRGLYIFLDCLEEEMKKAKNLGVVMRQMCPGVCILKCLLAPYVCQIEVCVFSFFSLPF